MRSPWAGQDVAFHAVEVHLDELGAGGGVHFADDFGDGALERARGAVERRFDFLAEGEAIEEADGDGGFEAHPQRIVDGEQEHAGVGEVAGFDAALGNDAGDGRFDLGVGQHDLDFRDLGPGGVVHRFRGGQRLLGRGLFLEELLGAFVFGLGLVELGFGGGELLADVAVVERDELLALLHAVAGGGEHLVDVGRNARAEMDFLLGRRRADDVDPHGRGFGLHGERGGVWRHRPAGLIFEFARRGLLAEKASGPDDDGREADQAEEELEVFLKVDGWFHGLASWGIQYPIFNNQYPMFKFLTTDRRLLSPDYCPLSPVLPSSPLARFRLDRAVR